MSYYNGSSSSNKYQPSVKLKEPTKTVMVPNFSAFSAQANINRAESSRSSRHRSRSPETSSSSRENGHSSSREKKQYYASRERQRGHWTNESKYYCEVCCINCIGKQSFEAHIVGQQHLKRVKNAASQKKEQDNPSPSGSVRKVENFCEVCNVVCSSAEAYGAHLRGQKHQKSMKLWSKLGKPIPDSLKPQVVKVIPKTNFTVGGTLNTLTGQMTEASDRPQTSQTPVIASSDSPLEQKEEKPIIGKECIVEERDKFGKVVNYKCTICDCDMNNKYMRDDHLKGRKHLTEYKLKVNPNLQVNDKRLIDTFKQIEQIRMQAEQQEMMRREHREQGMRNKFSQREREALTMFPDKVQLSSTPSCDDNTILRKHSEINPAPVEIQAVDSFLSIIEHALKLVSDKLCEERQSKEKDLKAVMRIGPFAKGTALKGEKLFDLVVLCAKKPDEPIINSIYEHLKEKIVEVNAGSEFEISLDVPECLVKVVSKAEPNYECKVNITSPAVREDLDPTTDPPEMLSKTACNKSLAEMRHAKWFDSKSKMNSSLIIIVKILRDLRNRIPTWQAFPVYVVELLCDKALRTVAHEMGPGELLRRFFEILAAGILLPAENGVYDPCEKNNFNAASCISQQDSQDITTSAQHALRLIAMNQLEKVLGLKLRGTPTAQQQLQSEQTVSAQAPLRPQICSPPDIPARPLLQRPQLSFPPSHGPPGLFPPNGPRPPFTGYARPPFIPNAANQNYLQNGMPVQSSNYPNCGATQNFSAGGVPVQPPPRFVPPPRYPPHSDPVAPFKKIKTEFTY